MLLRITGILIPASRLWMPAGLQFLNLALLFCILFFHLKTCVVLRGFQDHTSKLHYKGVIPVIEFH